MNQEIDARPLMVSIWCTTYNHEPYIRQCLEGFVMQKTNFRFEAIVHDDASTDGTAAIIHEYAEKYPDIIKPIYKKENQYSKHDDSLGKIMDEACTGKYIALCEGDDYWTDPLHLNKQVTFLEKNPECVYSCCRYLEYNEITKEERIPPNPFLDEKNNTYFFFDRDLAFKNVWFTKTHTSVYRRMPNKIERYKKLRYYRDVHMVYELLSFGKGVCHSYICGVYRINLGSSFGGYSEKEKFRINYDVYYEFSQATKDCIISEKAQFFYKKLLFAGVYIWPHNIVEFLSLGEYCLAKLRIFIGKIRRKIIV